MHYLADVSPPFEMIQPNYGHLTQSQDDREFIETPSSIPPTNSILAIYGDFPTCQNRTPKCDTNEPRNICGCRRKSLRIFHLPVQQSCSKLTVLLEGVFE
jgi:hypothetical protein